MNYFYKNNFVVKIFAFLCTVVTICLSPYVKYIDASTINNVYATGLEIPATLGAEAVVDFLLGFFATVAGEEVIRNRESISEAYGAYLDGKTAEIPDVSEPCLQFYDISKGQEVLIPWSDVTDSLHNYHETAVDGLTDIYAKYCPQLLGSMKDFVTDVLSGDVYIEGFSDTLVDYAPVTAADIAEQYSGHGYKLSFSCTTNGTYRCVNCGSQYYELISAVNVDYFEPIAVYCDSIGYSFRSGSSGDVVKVQYVNTHSCCGYKDYHSDYSFTNGIFNSFTASVPIFTSLDALRNYLKTGTGYEDAINFGQSMYDNITDNVDLPPFYKTWQQELWERVANAPDIGIGSYGAGVATGANDWADDIPWVGLGSLWDYIDSVQDVYEKAIDDIINGVYDPTKDIPDTYSDAWEDSIADTWDDVVDLPVDRPGVKDPAIPGVDNPAIPGVDDPAIPGIDDPAISDTDTDITINVSDYQADLRGIFPFCIPFDFIALLNTLDATPVAPCFDFPVAIPALGYQETIKLDMSVFDDVAKVIRICERVSFLIFLMFATSKVIRW